MRFQIFKIPKCYETQSASSSAALFYCYSSDYFLRKDQLFRLRLAFSFKEKGLRHSEWYGPPQSTHLYTIFFSEESWIWFRLVSINHTEPSCFICQGVLPSTTWKAKQNGMLGRPLKVCWDLFHVCNVSRTEFPINSYTSFATFVWTGKSKEEAMTDYITKVKQLLEEAAAASTS